MMKMMMTITGNIMQSVVTRENDLQQLAYNCKLLPSCQFWASSCWTRTVSTDSENPPVCLLLAFRWQCVRCVFTYSRYTNVHLLTYLLTYFLCFSILEVGRSTWQTDRRTDRHAGNLDALLAMLNNHSADVLMPFFGKLVEWPRKRLYSNLVKKQMPTNFII